MFSGGAAAEVLATYDNWILGLHLAIRNKSAHQSRSLMRRLPSCSSQLNICIFLVTLLRAYLVSCPWVMKPFPESDLPSKQCVGLLEADHCQMQASTHEHTSSCTALWGALLEHSFPTSHTPQPACSCTCLRSCYTSRQHTDQSMQRYWQAFSGNSTSLGRLCLVH